MPSFLPANLLALFAPRDPIPFLPPPDKLPHEKKTNGYTGVGEYLHIFEDPKDTPPPTRVETREERQKRRKREKAEQVAYKLEQDIALWDPYNNAAATSDAYKTLFVARINYDTSESKLRREFEVYGPIKKIGIVHDKNSGKPRGYAFIEYEHARDMHSAYKHADGKKIDGRRILVDVERGRTVKGWLPRRLGGGLGGTRRGGPEVNVKHSGREERLEDRYINDRSDRSERGRDRDDRERERERRRGSRSRSRERRRRSRSRSRERRRESRHRREKSRDRVRDRDLRDIEKMDGVDGNAEVIAPEIEKKERGRKRSRSRDRKRRRSRSRDRSSKRRERDRDRESSRREKVRDKDDRITGEEIQVKQEASQDGYSSGSMGYEGGEFDSKFTSDANSFNNNSYGDGDRNVYNSEDYS